MSVRHNRGEIRSGNDPVVQKWLNGQLDSVLVAEWPTDRPGLKRQLWREHIGLGMSGWSTDLSFLMVSEAMREDGYPVRPPSRLYEHVVVQSDLIMINNNPFAPFFLWALRDMGLLNRVLLVDDSGPDFLSSVPAPGTYSLPSEEMEIYSLLGENPFAMSNEKLTAWAVARSEARGTG